MGLKREGGHINILSLKRGGGGVYRGFTVHGQQAIGAKENVYNKKRWFVWDTNMASSSLFWNTNMAAVMSCENAL